MVADPRERESQVTPTKDQMDFQEEAKDASQREEKTLLSKKRRKSPPKLHY